MATHNHNFRENWFKVQTLYPKECENCSHPMWNTLMNEISEMRNPAANMTISIYRNL